jgi:tetratricopeptide (TPR) repeat protein
MRLTNLQQSGHTLKGGEDREGFHAKMQPREHFKRGKDSFLRGRYQDALQHLEVIRSNDSGLTVVEQRQAADYLSRAKSRLQAAATGSVVRAQSSPFEVDDDWSDSAADDVSSSAKDSSRSRVDRLMSQAESALKKGNPKDAIKLAQQAHRIAIGSDLKYAKAETSPAMFLSRMSSDSTSDTVVGVAASKRQPFRRDIRQVSAEIDSGNVETTPRHSTEQTNAASDLSVAEKRQAVVLISQAREHLKSGNYEEARTKARQAAELNLTYDLFEDRPELLLADIDRQTATMTLSRTNAKAGSQNTVQAPAVTDGKSVPQSPKQQALRLLELAREDLSQGQFDAANSKAEQAARLKVAFKLFDDMPELVISDIATQRAQAGLASSKSRAVQQTAASTKPAKIPANGLAAKSLLKKARQAMLDGRTDEAKQIVAEAEQLNAVYNLFDDRPDIVLSDIERAATHRTDVAADSGRTPKSSRKSPTSGVLVAGQVPESATSTPEIEFAVTTDAGKFETQEATAHSVSDAMDTSQAVAGGESANPVGSATEESSIETLAGGPARRTDAVRRRMETMSPDTSPELSSDGPSGAELFKRGIAELNRNNRIGAYAAFLAAYQSGQKLDPVQTQRLHVYLRELAPKTDRRNIQLAAGTESETPSIAEERASSDSTGQAEDHFPGLLDVAEQEQVVKFDRLRSEILNAVFKAERMKEKDPEGALTH